MLRIATFILILMLSHGLCSGQSVKAWLKQGDKAIDEFDYRGAIEYYSKALQIDSNQLDTRFRLGQAYRLHRDYSTAANYYLWVTQHDEKLKYPESYYWLGEMRKHEGKYGPAKEAFEQFKKVSADRQSLAYRKAKHEVVVSSQVQQIASSAGEAEVSLLKGNVNTVESEFSPFPLNDSTLLFATLRFQSTELNDETPQSFIQIHQAEKRDDGWWSQGMVDSIIFEEGLHAANGSISPDGKRMYFSKCDQNRQCDIYLTRLTQTGWTVPQKQEAPINIEGYSTTQPMLASVDGQEVLFFASDRPKGKGKLDIWYVNLSDGRKVPKARNLGSTVNSKGNELSPFYDAASQTFYFSSSWHNSIGGFDVFKSSGSLSSLSEPENMQPPINSSADDYYFSFYSEKNLGFLASNRKGGILADDQTCCNDIYQVTLPIPEVDSAPPPPMVVEQPPATINDLKRVLPITLYFHNDVPNPRSTDTVTSLNYMKTYSEYLNMEDEYIQKATFGLTEEESSTIEEGIEHFFVDSVEQGVKQLKQAADVLLEELQNGARVNLAVKGYASPLAKSDYNLNLTLRRISSLENFMEQYKDGALLPYLQNQSDSGAQLKIIRIPYGEERADNTVSDQLANQQQSVYSVAAALERKIEILSIEKTAQPKLVFDQPEKELGPIPGDEPTIITYRYTNEGDAPLHIISAKGSCGCTVPEWSDKTLMPGERGEIKVVFDPTGKSGRQHKIVTIVSNADPNVQQIRFYADIKP